MPCRCDLPCFVCRFGLLLLVTFLVAVWGFFFPVFVRFAATVALVPTEWAFVLEDAVLLTLPFSSLTRSLAWPAAVCRDGYFSLTSWLRWVLSFRSSSGSLIAEPHHSMNFVCTASCVVPAGNACRSLLYTLRPNRMYFFHVERDPSAPAAGRHCFSSAMKPSNCSRLAFSTRPYHWFRGLP